MASAATQQQSNVISINSASLRTHSSPRPGMMNYMTLNPMIVRAAEQIAGCSLSTPLDPRMHYRNLPTLTEQEADLILHYLHRTLPRQYHCPPPDSGLTIGLEYAACLIDTEGYCGATGFHTPGRKHPGHRLMVCISQNHLQTLQHGASIIGANHGRKGPYKVKRNLTQNKPCYTLNYNNAHALHALARVYPYLVRKREIAIMMLRLFIEGRLWEHPGSRGVHPQVRAIRHKHTAKIKRML